MLEHPTFFSWWNLGLVRFHIISFYRFYESENKIILNIRGKDRIKQKIKKSSKITFISKFVYNQNWINTRWGENYENLIDLCKSNSSVPSNKRLGYGDVFSNIIFYHSVPNNTPGIIWFSKKHKWEALMPNRTVPAWLINLLEINENTIAPRNIFSDEILNTLVLIKKGVKKTNSVSQRLGVDVKYAIKLLNHMKIMRLIDENTRLTSRGLDILHKNRKINLPDWDYGLYIPRSWCADKKNI